MAFPRELRGPILYVRGSDPREQGIEMCGTASMPRYDAAEICRVTFSSGRHNVPFSPRHPALVPAGSLCWSCVTIPS